MALVLNVNNVSTNNFKKCGEITTQGKNEFFLVCNFCKKIYLKLDDFIEHIGQEHLNDVYEHISTIKNETGEDNESSRRSSVARKKKNKVLAKREQRNVKPRSYIKQIEMDLTLTAEQGGSNSDPLEVSNTDVKSEPMEIEGELVEHLEEQRDDADSRDPFQEEFDNTSTRAKMKQSKIESELDVPNNVTAADCRSVIDNKDKVIIAIIAEYKEHPVLWSNDYPHSKYKSWRIEALQQITSKINDKFDSNFEWRHLREQIKKLRSNYTKNPSIWYAGQLEFLDSTIEHNQRMLRNAKLYKKTKPGLPFQNLSEEKNIQLINIYKRYPTLWDLQSIEYRFKNRRQAALSEMQETVKDELNMELTESQLQNKITRIRYTSSAEKQRKIQCERLKKPYEPICQYSEHITFLEVNVGPFKCEECKQLFPTIDRYQIHKATHDGSMPFTCPLCDRGFMAANNLTIHLRRHTRDFPYECETCKKRFATSTDMNVHMRQHTGEKPYFCEICGQSFRTWTFYDVHSRRHLKKTTHKCSICPKAYYYNAELKEHMKSHLDVRDKECNVCGKTFKTTKNLRQHKEIHAEKKKYVCKLCGKDFAQYAGLSGHMKSHGTTLIECGGAKCETDAK